MMANSLKYLKPLKQAKTASERVAERLRELIASGNIKPGEKLPSENELVAALQVSRPVVREALRGLSMMGVIEIRKGGGCFVTDLSVERLMQPLSFLWELHRYSLDDLFAARGLIDAEVAADAARHADTEQKARLGQLVELGHTLVGDPVGFRVMDAEFHGLIAEACGNAFLRQMSEAMYNLAIELRRAASQMPGVLTQSATDHGEIAAAISSGDAAAAAGAMRYHTSNIHETTIMAQKRKPG